ncbi:MAG: hypothetical protein ABIN80_05950 [Dyadobacter sp.]|uniref:hypothetical protein n=1 Tax=Dyadobacter sp. TaxID=1914288 RepID=UPI003266ADAE
MEKLTFTAKSDFFITNYDIDFDSIQLVFAQPYRSLKISQTKTLFYRKIDKENHSHLLICSKRIGVENQLSFAFWIPDDLVTDQYSLEDMLEQFARRFGSLVKLNDEEAIYIRNGEMIFVGDVNEFDKLMTTRLWENTPHFRHYIVLLDGNIAVYSFAFAINNYKYWVWLRNIEVQEVEIKAEWANYLDNIVQNLNPVKKTKLEIITSKLNPYLETAASSTREVGEIINFNVPKIYSHQMHAIKQSLQKGNNVYVAPSQTVKRCVFCGEISPSQEHILPSWFRDYFEEITFHSMTHIMDVNDLANSFEFGLSKGKESSYGITTHEVCVKCNNEWMSDLETEVKAILTKDPSSLKSTLEDLQLTPDKSFALVKWLICKALLLAKRSKTLPDIDIEIFKKLKEGELHHAFLVEILPVSGFGLNYQISPELPMARVSKDNQETVAKLSPDFFVVVLHIGRFFYRISYWEHDSTYPRVSVSFKTISLFPLNTLWYLELDIDLPTDDNSKLMLFAQGLQLTERNQE